jgi:DNA-binding transcriptional MerR regulator
VATQTVVLVDGEPAMTPSEVAALLGMTTERVRQLGTDGRLAAVGRAGQMRLYRRADVEALAAQRHDGAMPPARGRRGRQLPSTTARRKALEERRSALRSEQQRLAAVAASVAAELAGLDEAVAMLDAQATDQIGHA